MAARRLFPALCGVIRSEICSMAAQICSMAALRMLHGRSRPALWGVGRDAPWRRGCVLGAALPLRRRPDVAPLFACHVAADFGGSFRYPPGVYNVKKKAGKSSREHEPVSSSLRLRHDPSCYCSSPILGMLHGRSVFKLKHFKLLLFIAKERRLDSF